MQELGNIEQNDESAVEFSDAGDVGGFAVGENGSRRFDFGRRNFQDFRGGIDDEAEKFGVKLHDENTIFLVRRDFRLAETLAEIHYRNDFAAQVDDAFDGVGSVGNRGDFRDANDFTDRADTDSERFVPDAKTHNLEIFFHERILAAL